MKRRHSLTPWLFAIGVAIITSPFIALWVRGEEPTIQNVVEEIREIRLTPTPIPPTATPTQAQLTRRAMLEACTFRSSERPTYIPEELAFEPKARCSDWENDGLLTKGKDETTGAKILVYEDICVFDVDFGKPEPARVSARDRSGRYNDWQHIGTIGEFCGGSTIWLD